jgi:hypothetical protein
MGVFTVIFLIRPKPEEFSGNIPAEFNNLCIEI